MGMVSEVNFVEMAKSNSAQDSVEVATADLKGEMMLGAMETNSNNTNEVK